MPDQTRRDIDEWHLGIDGPEVARPQAPAPVKEPEPPPLPSLSDHRLDTPLYVVTVEHLGWAALALYALLTRLGALGLRPLDFIEASRALFAREIAGRGLGVLSVEQPSGWLDVLRAGVFLAFGASDFGARIVAAVFGLALIAAAFAMRRQLGRAGALAFASMLTVSPTLTYFSRSASPTIPAIALILIMLALMFALVGASDTFMVVGVAIAIAAALSAEPIALPIAAIFLAILLVMGIGELILRRNPMIRFRVWWERRSAQLMFCMAIAIGLFVALETAIGRRNLLLAMVYGAVGQWLPVLHPDFRGGLAFYLPAIAFYEFAIAIFGLLGALAFVVSLLRSRVAVIAFLWTIFSAAFFLADPVHWQDWITMMLVPAALLGAVLIDAVHRTNAWRWFRYPVAVLMLLTIYVQLAINFVRVAPNPSEAPWSRHLLLFWTNPATTALATEEFAHASRAVTDRGTAFLAEESPIARWYLRDLNPADTLADADLVVSPASSDKPSEVRESYAFTLDEKWTPNFAGLRPSGALRYFFTQNLAADVSSTEVRVDVRSPTPVTATPAPSPSASAAPSESPTAQPSISPSPAPSSVPAAVSSATSSAQATAPSSAAPTATPTTAPTMTPTAAPTISMTPAPSIVPSAVTSPAPTASP
jgi:uncharacterized protein (TIGR03663 family)